MWEELNYSFFFGLAKTFSALTAFIRGEVISSSSDRIGIYTYMQ